MRKNKFFTLLFVSLFFIISNLLSSCDLFATSFTITWKNYDGTVLEIDKNVAYDAMPSYDGKTPMKEGTADISYTFLGWTPQISKVKGDAIYTATFKENNSTFIIVWKNYDGTILEEDNNCTLGSLPTYDGETPTKDSNGNISYTFNGWTPEVVNVVANATYTATFKEIVDVPEDEIKPVFLDNNKVEYGLYPQTHVNDETLISSLNSLTPSNINGWYLYNDKYYVKEKASVFNKESYVFDDGTSIVDGNEYWFECKPITWLILKGENDEYLLLAEVLLDVYSYYSDYATRIINEQKIYANNYEQSDIRKWLNEDFYNQAFALGKGYIQNKEVDNGITSTSPNNQYVCNDTLDKVYLPSYQDYLNESYGFESDNNKSITRACKTTDYARAKGAWCNIKTTDVGEAYKYNGTYWTRSPASEYYYCAWNINSGGYLSTYAVDGDSHCVRPCISIYFK